MKVISIWQPFASLLVKGFKIFETRTWPAPQSAIGRTIGIASTKGIRPAQRAFFQDESFCRFYENTAMDPITELPCGYLLGTVTLDSVELMTEEFLDEVSDEEQAYGMWELGNYAWRMTDRRELPFPIPIRGAQGLYEWKGDLPDGFETQVSTRPAETLEQQECQVVHQEKKPNNRGGLRLVKW